MKLCKKLVLCLLAVAVVLLCFVAFPQNAYATSSSDLTFTLNSTEDGYVVSNCKGTASGELVIPDTYKGLPVTAIGDRAFYYQNGITSLVIPDSITTIGKDAFAGCIKLTSITIGSGVKFMAENVFSANSILENVYIHDVKAWCEIEFANARSAPLYFADNLYLDGELVTVLEIPEGTTKIGDMAFMSYDHLTSVAIPDSVTSIGESAFHYCKGLTSIAIPDSVTCVGEWAFGECDGLIEATIGNGVTRIEYATFASCDNLNKLVIGNGVTSIEEAAFSVCRNLRSVTISDSVTSVHRFAFTECAVEEMIFTNGTKTITTTMLVFPEPVKHVVIPDSVTSIEIMAFGKCSHIEGVYISDIKAWCEMEFFGEEANPLLHGAKLYLNGTLVKDLVIPDNVTQIDDYAFFGYSGLTSVTIGNGVTSIGKSAFQNCIGLGSVSIPDNVTSMGDSAFQNCSSLGSVTIGNGLTKIGEYVFEKCYGLTSVTIGSNVSSIGYYAFADCTNLTNIVLPNSVTLIDYNAFRECIRLSSITLSDSLTVLRGDAFYGCKSLTSVTIPDSIISIAGSAFDGCDELSYNIDQNVKYLGNDKNPYLVLMDATDWQITAVQIHSDTKVIGGGAFGACRWLTSIVIPNGVVGIGGGAFGGCHNLSSITIPNSVIRIDEAAFNECNSLTSITIPDSVTVIEEQTFFSCDSLASITIPDSVTYIGESAFQNCVSLTDVTIPDSVTAFGESVFHGCKALTSIRIPDGVTSISKYMFVHCTGLTNIIIPQSVVSIDGMAFDGCDSLATVTYCGTQQQWNAVNIMGDYNKPSQNAKIQYHKYENGVCTICRHSDEGFWVYRLDSNEELAKETIIYVNGLPYEVKADGEGRYVELPKEDELLLVTYTYHEGDGQDVHTQYPTGMKVYLVKDGEITHISQLDNLLQYSGASIRITGKKGIRMITSIAKDKKTALTGKGLAGYTLVEYGTALCFANEIPEGDALVLGRSYARSNYANKRGVADPVFATTKDLVQYTNVLVGFSLDQCKDDIAMRPYIILKNANGEQFTIYGGTIYRSIGYIAYQNRSVFQPKTASYNYVWEIIHHVYGDKYDADYKG